ncbi:hypothetical protein ACH5RR_014502 [Cinchona calisaya]|uniref:Phytocyanin domain-containing protein n=1 Tax=Cinchona calisaya TaxID=153742 RepID=A0ABD3A308_9GENT
MASHFSSFSTHIVVLALILFSSLQLSRVSSFDYQVGEKLGWVVPPANDSKVYNDWASEKRFKIGDTIRFKYRKDSVMEVNETDYKKCNSTRPNFFSNTGNTVFTLDRSGYFYFISGASGHCDKGQRMIVKVMSLQDQNSPSSSADGRRFVMHDQVVNVVTFQVLLFAYHVLASHI